MDYTVAIERLADHGRDVSAANADAAAATSAVQLDGAISAMAGSLSAAASSALQSRFESAATKLGASVTKYVRATQAAADGYRQQEDESTSAINAFFGG